MVSSVNPSHRAVHAGGRRRRATTLIEMLVVFSMIGFLITLIIPSLKRSMQLASATVCRHNLKQVGTSLLMYRQENEGWLPLTKYVETSIAAVEPSNEAWFAMLFPTYMADPLVLRCPADPYGYRMVEMRDRIKEAEAEDAPSYGVSDFLLNAGGGYLAQERRWPRFLSNTILAADLGPDDLRDSQRYGTLNGPSRNGSLMNWSDGWDPYGDPPARTWLTKRHGHGIHILTMDAGVRDTHTKELLRSPVKRKYPNCAAGGCALCNELRIPHYSFAQDHLYWWTGPIPTE